MLARIGGGGVLKCRRSRIWMGEKVQLKMSFGTWADNAASSPNQKCAAVFEVAIAIFASLLMDSKDVNT